MNFDINLYTKVYFRLNSDYKWGKGWSKSLEDLQEYDQDNINIMNALGEFIHNEVNQNDVMNMSLVIVDKDGQKLFFHSQNISGTILKSNLERYTKVIQEYQSKHFFLHEVDTYPLRENVTSNESGYSDNPNIVYERYYLKYLKNEF